MHVIVLFYNIGGYHAARLKATQDICNSLGWSLTVIQDTDFSQEHPWGNIDSDAPIVIHTLLPSRSVPDSIDRSPYSKVSAARLLDLLPELKPDVLVIPGWGFPVSQAALRWAKENHLPAILMSESKWDDEPRKWWKEFLKSWIYIKKYDAALVGGERHRDYLIKLGFPKDKIFKGYDVVNNDYFTVHANAARKNLMLTREKHPKIPCKPYFFAATRFIPRKNIVRLIDAYVRYRNRLNDDIPWDLVIAGSGSEEINIRRKIQSHKLKDNVHLPGFIGYNTISNWYGLAQAFVHPAWQEQWGLVINEACASGLPILCSCTIGASELVRENENGFTFDPFNLDDIAEKLINMHHLSPERRLQFGASSQSIISQYSPDAFGLGLKKAILKALQTRK